MTAMESSNNPSPGQLSPGGAPAAGGWEVETVLRATGGQLLTGGRDTVFRAVVTDTRQLGPGDLFVALIGEHFDGHAFLAEAVRKGAAGLLVSAAPESLGEVPVILVGDTLKALGDLAAWRRAAMPGLRVVAITGSSGKTTVKEMTAAILSRGHNILKTKGNFNNLVGLPLSLLPVEPAQEFAVLEMGMNRPGEIARLTEIAAPDIACILNVMESHLAGLGDIEGVARGKGELFAGLGAEAIMVVNNDDPRVVALAAGCPQRQISFGTGANALVRATHIRGLGEEGILFTLHVGEERRRITIRQPGLHTVANGLAAAAMAHAAGAPLDDIVAGLESFAAAANRLAICQVMGGLKVVNDTYNANPGSVRAALATLRDLAGNRKQVAVLGDMLELGAHSVAAHRGVGETAAAMGCDLLFAVGRFAEQTVEGARAGGMDNQQARVFASKEEIVAHVRKLVVLGDLAAGDWLLVKGSRGMRMETVVDGLVGPL